MKKILLILGCLFFSQFLFAQKKATGLNNASIIGTWKLLASKKITPKDTVVTYPLKGESQETLKMFNGSHFSFFTHDLQKGKVPTPAFSAGSGTYVLSGNQYSEHLIYCSHRDWENTKFKFTLTLKGDTLTQKGIEHIESLNINHEIVEVYVRVKR